MSRDEPNLVFVPASLNASEKMVGNMKHSPRYRRKSASDGQSFIKSPANLKVYN